MKQFFLNNKNSIWFWLFLGILVVLFFLMPIMSTDAGNTGDEDPFQIPQGENVLNYFKTGGADTTCMSFQNLKYYGSSFDVVIAFVNDTFNVEKINITRHIFNSLFGWLTILFIGLIAYQIAGWRAGVIAVVLAFLSPRLLGHAFNNPKDIPFAASIIGAIYFMLLFFKQFPKVKKTTLLFFILLIALSISVRIGGLILFGFFGLFALLFIIQQSFNRKNELKATLNKGKNGISFFEYVSIKEIGRLFTYGIGICIIGYFLGLILWPYALQNPIKNPLEAFSEMSKFATSLRQLFEGSLQWSDTLPWYYTPKYILMTVPIAVIIGFLIYPFIGGCKKENRFQTFIIYFACIFPVFWIIYSNANVYGGWRHAMFAYPPMVVCAALGFNALIDLFKNKYLKIAATALPFLLLLPPALHIIRNHPYEYVYFNKLSGGMENAYGNYEMDYYYHSTREATEWIIANAERSGLETGDKIIVSSWHPASVGYYLSNDTTKFLNGFSRWYERGDNDWDYSIFVITGMMPEQIKSEHFPPKNTVHTIDVDGKPICLILKRDDKSDFMGAEFKKAGQLDSAVYYLQKAIAIDPYNESALIGLTEMYMQAGQLDSAKTHIDKLLSYLPKNETANFFLAHYYLAKNELDSALAVCKTTIGFNHKFRSAYHLANNIYIRKNDIKSAEKILVEMIDTDQLDDQAVQQLVAIYKSQGMTEALAYKKLYRVMAKSYEKRGKKKEAEIYSDMAKQIR